MEQRYEEDKRLFTEFLKDPNLSEFMKIRCKHYLKQTYELLLQPLPAGLSSDNK